MSDLAAIITASVGVLTASGGGIAFVWNKVERGLQEVRGELRKCEDREKEMVNREMQLRRQMLETSAKHVTIIELLWQEVERRSRGSTNPVLARVRKLLDDLKEQSP